MRYLRHTCTACGHVDSIDWGLLFSCPDCLAPSGQPCQDLRGRAYRSNAKVHQSRRDLADQVRVSGRRRDLQSAS